MISKKTKLLVAFSIFVTSLGFFIFPVIATTISDQYISQDSSKINSTGYYFQDTRAFVRTADVVVCRGTSVLDDLYKQFTCDVVCKSTDTDCTDNIQGAIDSLSSTGGNVYVGSGLYPIVITSPSKTVNYGNTKATILFDNGVNLVGAGKDLVFFNLTGTVDSDGSVVLATTCNNVSSSSVYNKCSHLSGFTIDFNAPKLSYGSYSGNKFLIGISSDNNKVNQLEFSCSSTFSNINFIDGSVTSSASSASIQSIGLNTFDCPKCSYDTLYFDKIDNSVFVTRQFPLTVTNYQFNDIHIDNSNLVGLYIEASNGDNFNNFNILNSSAPVAFKNGIIFDEVLTNFYIEKAFGNGITFYTDGVTVHGVVIDGFVINGTIASTTNYHGIAFADADLSGVKISDGFIQNCNKSGHGISITTGSNIHMDNIDVSGCQYGFKLVGTNSLITNSRAYNNRDAGFDLQEGRCINCIAYDNYAGGTINSGFRLDGSPVNNVELINPQCYNFSSNTQTKCIDVFQSNKTIIINSNIRNMANNISLNGAQYNFYSDNYLYSAIPNACTISGAFNERTIYNSTAGCRCTGGSWKCWEMS